MKSSVSEPCRSQLSNCKAHSGERQGKKQPKVRMIPGFLAN